MQPSDDERLRHMLDAAREAVAIASTKAGADVHSDRTLALALVKLIEIIGEAAINVSRERRDALVAIPWALIAATRNRLIHGYYDVDVDIVWKTVQEDLPPLIIALDASIENR